MEISKGGKKEAERKKPKATEEEEGGQLQFVFPRKYQVGQSGQSGNKVNYQPLLQN